MIFEQALTREYPCNFFLSEYTRSATAEERGIQNTLDWGNPRHHIIYDNLRYLAELSEIIRVKLDNHPMDITSGLRLPLLNKAVGGVEGSQHETGEAEDFVCPGFGTPLEIVKKLKDDPEVDYDQIIYENNGKGQIWCHISRTRHHKNRREVLTLLANGKYASGLTDSQGKPL